MLIFFYLSAVTQCPPFYISSLSNALLSPLNKIYYILIFFVHFTFPFYILYFISLSLSPSISLVNFFLLKKKNLIFFSPFFVTLLSHFPYYNLSLSNTLLSPLKKRKNLHIFLWFSLPFSITFPFRLHNLYSCFLSLSLWTSDQYEAYTTQHKERLNTPD